MATTHGTLENTILSAVWYIEENHLRKEITVNDIYELIQRTDTPRAYTTIKTVMDRLVDKNLLIRVKKGKKFEYNSVHSRETTANQAIQKIAQLYFNDDIHLLSEAVRNICNSSKMSVM